MKRMLSNGELYDKFETRALKVLKLSGKWFRSIETGKLPEFKLKPLVESGEITLDLPRNNKAIESFFFVPDLFIKNKCAYTDMIIFGDVFCKILHEAPNKENVRLEWQSNPFITPKILRNMINRTSFKMINGPIMNLNKIETVGTDHILHLSVDWDEVRYMFDCLRISEYKEFLHLAYLFRAAANCQSVFERYCIQYVESFRETKDELELDGEKIRKILGIRTRARTDNSLLSMNDYALLGYGASVERTGTDSYHLKFLNSDLEGCV